MKLSTVELSRAIKDKSEGRLKLKDIQETLKLLEATTKEELEKGNTVQLRSLIKLTPIEYKEAKKYDGINKRYYLKNSGLKVSVKTLKTLTTLERKDNA